MTRRKRERKRGRWCEGEKEGDVVRGGGGVKGRKKERKRGRWCEGEKEGRWCDGEKKGTKEGEVV